MPEMTTLMLAKNQIGDAGMAHLSHVQGMLHLSLNFNHLGDTEARHLSYLKEILHLSLNGNQLGDEGASPCYDRLESRIQSNR